MDTQVEIKRQNSEKPSGKMEWLLARSGQANRRYSRAQMEAFAILRDSLTDSDTAMECLRNGACGYIIKPFDIKGLLDQVDNCIASPP